MDLFRDIIVMLATQGWQKLADQQATPSSTLENTEGQDMFTGIDST